MRNLYFILVFSLIFVFLACGGPKKEEPKSVEEAGKPTTEAAPETAQALAQKTNLPAPVWGEIKRAKNPVVIMETNFGNMEIELYWKETPKTSESFLYLVNKGFYDGLTFHRIVPNFVIQGGDPLGNGTGGPGYTIPDESTTKKHERGALGMAKSGPNTAGSQFYICLRDVFRLDDMGFTPFAHVVKGMDVVDKIALVPNSGPPDNRALEKVVMLNVYEKK
jgi:peptidyl-prolyl cis-trans isomerase A (cyclophilin A)